MEKQWSWMLVRDVVYNIFWTHSTFNMSLKRVFVLCSQFIFQTFSIEYFYSHSWINSRFYQSIFTLGNLCFTNGLQFARCFNVEIMSICTRYDFRNTQTFECLWTLWSSICTKDCKGTSLLSVMALGKGYLSFNALGSSPVLCFNYCRGMVYTFINLYTYIQYNFMLSASAMGTCLALNTFK